MYPSSQSRCFKSLGRVSLLSVIAAVAATSCSDAGGSDESLPPSFLGTGVAPGQQQPGTITGPNQQPVPANNPGTVTAVGANQPSPQPAAQQPAQQPAQPTNEGQGTGQIDSNQQPSVDPENGGQQNGDQQGAGGAPGASNMGSAGAGMMVDPAPMQNTGGSAMPAQQPPAQPPVQTPPTDCGTALLCDDFEGVAAGGSPDPALWDLIVAYNPTQGQTDAVQVTTAQAHSGSQSVFVSGDNGRTGMIGTIAASDYYVRAWMFAEAAPLGPVLAGFGSDGNNEVRFRIWNNSWATINSTVGDDLVPAAARAGNCPDCPVVPAGQWFCMEYFVNDSAQTATLSIDGQEAAVLNGSWPNMPAEPQIFLGVMRIQDGANIYVDDVVASLNPIGCE